MRKIVTGLKSLDEMNTIIHETKQIYSLKNEIASLPKLKLMVSGKYFTIIPLPS